MLLKLKGYRFPWSIIHFCVYTYHRFSLSYRDVEELMFVRGLTLHMSQFDNGASKFVGHFNNILK